MVNHQSKIVNLKSLLSLRVRQTIRRDPIGWASSCGINLHPYQRGVALAIKDSILHQKGLTFVVIFPRQSGKNEVQAHIFSWLLYRYSQIGGRIVSVSPTYKPQTLDNMERVAFSLDACVGSRHLWKTSVGYKYKLGKACVQFFSGDKRAKVVGAVANLLLSVDEAQLIDPAKFDKDFDPMSASVNTTRVFWGTAWIAGTLLERQRRYALQAQEKDGIQRVFFFTADDVRRVNHKYGDHVDRVIAERGRNHPLVRTQYFCETIDAQSGMFTPARTALIFPSMQAPSPNDLHLGRAGVGLAAEIIEGVVGLAAETIGRGAEHPVKGETQNHNPDPIARGEAAFAEHPLRGTSRNRPPLRPESQGSPVAFLIDVAGMDESKTSLASSLADEGLGNPGRDSTTLTIVAIDLSTLAELNHPTYRVLARHSWTGQNHLTVFGQIKNFAGQWSPQYLVTDATGVGEGLWALLDRAFPTRVMPVKFTSKEKSEIGWGFLNIIETGRFIDPSPTDEVRLQYRYCISEVLQGPMKTLRWGVPDGTRGPDGELIHDDYILADALTVILDRMKWHISTAPFFSEGYDPLVSLGLIDPSDRSYAKRY